MGLRVSVLLVVRRLWSSEHLGSACHCALLEVVQRRLTLSRCRAVNDSNVGTAEVADICRKMAAKRSESKGSSDDGGRRGQQQHRLLLRYDFLAASSVSCSNGVAAIGGKWGSDVHDFCEEE
ncbi:hypothetical protein BHM03_00062897 [Ensete ventricosum]|nr:hypothetical protein BHM03_00062897 [Ensete ventricosum]